MWLCVDVAIWLCVDVAMWLCWCYVGYVGGRLTRSGMSCRLHATASSAWWDDSDSRDCRMNATHVAARSPPAPPPPPPVAAASPPAPGRGPGGSGSGGKLAGKGTDCSAHVDKVSRSSGLASSALRR
jgi:hypothetical protein